MVSNDNIIVIFDYHIDVFTLPPSCYGWFPGCYPQSTTNNYSNTRKKECSILISASQQKICAEEFLGL